MERKRTRSGLFSEEEQDRDRRSSQRFTKRIRYNEDDYEYVEEEEEEEVQEDNEQPGPSTQYTPTYTTQEKRFLPVTCGTKKGIMDVNKLSRGEECIESEGGQFAPPAFEDFGGKGPSKKWKTSIFLGNKPLQFWFEQGFLTTKGYKKRGNETAKRRRILSSDSESESSSEESETKSIISAAKKSALQTILQVLVKRLPEMSDPPVIGGIKEENGEEFSEHVLLSNDSEEDEQREIKTEAVNSSPSAPPSLDIKPADKDNLQGPEVGELDAGHCGEKEEEWRKRAVGLAMQRSLSECFEDCDSANNDHLDMPKSEDSGQAIANENISDANTSLIGGFKEESVEAMSVDPSIIPASVLVKCTSENSGRTDVIISGHNAAQLEELEQVERCCQTVQLSYVLEGPCSGPSADCDLDAMDLDQLKKKKIKMQLKVLKLQEEYYALKIRRYKQ
ncbi:uncharacterized protein LOC133998997 isoform X2 [Scomber scombrus]|uniref:uncharacterized protein LOC133998997 isoform X2 n=1 Tax=Scomber scombrus TaxID=13677 RepID=UPI002DD914B3|nr:uncharacterized protein LOC133998997 isoform X2 [Scomber scombrus]